MRRTMVMGALALELACREPASAAEDRPAVSSSTATETPTAVVAQTPAPGEAFVYRASVVAASVPGEAAEPLLELLSNGEVRIVVSTQREGASDPTVEIWTFDQRDEDGTLIRAGAPTPLLRTRPDGPSPPALAELRPRLAAPGVIVHRPRGVAAAGPVEALAALAGAARTARDPQAPARDRVAALAKVFAGMDDAIVLDRDGLAAALDALASDRWVANTTSAPSDRRATVTTTSGATLQLVRKDDRWVVTDAT